MCTNRNHIVTEEHLLKLGKCISYVFSWLPLIWILLHNECICMGISLHCVLFHFSTVVKLKFWRKMTMANQNATNTMPKRKRIELLDSVQEFWLVKSQYIQFNYGKFLELEICSFLKRDSTFGLSIRRNFWLRFCYLKRIYKEKRIEEKKN